MRLNQQITNSILLILSLQFTASQAVTSCSVSGASFYDGYLDPFIYFGNFDRDEGSYFKFSNPYLSESFTNTDTTIAFWAKLKSLTASEELYSGTFLDCSDIVNIQISNDTVSFEVDVTQDQLNLLEVAQFQSNLSGLLDWNHFSFVFSAGELAMYVNAEQVGTLTAQVTSIDSTATYCMIGNSLSENLPLNGYLRHFYISNSAWTTSTDIYTLMHHIFTPSDSAILSYFKFSQDFINAEYYLYDQSTTYEYNGMSIDFSNDPEFVCYCTGEEGLFLNVSSDFTLNSIDYSAYESNTLTSRGFQLEFYAYFQKQGNEVTEEAIFTIQDYATIYISNSSTSFSVVLQTDDGTDTIYFSGGNIRYNYWTWYKFQFTTSTAILYIDGSQDGYVSQTLTYTSTVPTNFQIESPTTVSYLLANITLKSYRSRAVADFFTSLSPSYTFDTNIVASSGSLQFGYSNSLCYATVQNLTTYWDGISCQDKRLFPYFSTSSSSIEANIVSSRSNMTIEMWIKDMDSDSSSTTVIFQNYFNSNQMLSLELTTGSSISDTRTISCYSQKGETSDNMIELTNVDSYRAWIHLACISNDYENLVSLFAYDQSSETLTQTSSSILNFYDQSSQISTFLGSDYQGANSFKGYIRELKLWNIPLTEYEVSLHRFQVVNIDEYYNGQYLVYYYQLNNGIDQWNLFDTGSGYIDFVDQTKSTTDWRVSFIEDTDLVVCPLYQFYNGLCCETFDISSADFTISYSTSKNQIQVSLDSTSISSTTLFDSLKANFSVLSVTNNFFQDTDVTYMDYIQQYFQQNHVQSYNVDSILINPVAYAIEIQAIIYSDLYMSVTTTKTQSITLDCPMLFLTIVENNAVDETQYVSSSSTETQPQINAIFQDTCFSTSSLSESTVSFSAITWSTNLTSLSLTDLFTESSDTYSLTAVSSKPSSIQDEYVSITATTTYDSSTEISQTIYLQFIDMQITTSYSSNQLEYNLNQGSDSLVIDLSSAEISPSTTTNTIIYSVFCPSSTFTTDELYDELCVISSSGVFTISDTSQLYLVADYPYYYQMQMQISSTSILSTYYATVYFSKDGGSTNCPRVELPSEYNYDINTNDIVQIIPDTYLTCSGTSHTISEVSWTVKDSLTGDDYISVLDFGTQTINKYANVTEETMTASGIMSGQILSVTLAYTLSDGSQFIGATSIVFSQNELQIEVTVYDLDGNEVSSDAISFIEQSIILNTDNSYDPDNLTATSFSYSWSCPSIVTAIYTCDSLVVGGYLHLSALQRSYINFDYETNYTFQVTMTSDENSYKNAATKDIILQFSAPQSTDSTNNEISTDCMTVSASGSLIFDTGLTRFPSAIEFNVNNQSSAAFSADLTNDVTSSTCSSYTINTQVLLMYVFDQGFFNDTDTAILLYTQTSSISNSESVSVTLADYFDLTNPDISFQTYIKLNLYFFTTYNDNPDSVFLSIYTFYLYKGLSDLIAQFVESSISLDQYGNLVLDASQSYDPDNLYDSYTYNWVCPSDLDCSEYTSSTITVTYIDRYQDSVNTVGTSYTYGVVMTDGDRESAQADATITITSLSTYEGCVTLSLNTNEINSLIDDTTIVIQYNQSNPIQIQMDIITSCDNSNINTPAFALVTEETISDPWIVDTYDYNLALLVRDNFDALTADQVYAATFTQTFSMGFDTSTTFTQVYNFNLMLTSPSLIADIQAPKIYTFDTDNIEFTLDGSSSNDPISQTFTQYWNCNSSLGGDECSTSLQYIVTQTNLDSSVTAAGGSLSDYLQQSYPYTLVLNSSDGTRSSYLTHYVFLADSSSIFNTSTQYCGIAQVDVYTYGLNKINKYKFSCDDDDTLTQEFQNQYSIIWSVNELVDISGSYFQVDNELFIDPYAINQVDGSYYNIQATISSLGYVFYGVFQTKIEELVQGTISLSSTTLNYYGAVYTMTFSGFTSTLQYGIQFQLRRDMETYDDISMPIKPLNSYYQTILLENIIFGSDSNYVFDFYDMSFNYIGSYNFTTEDFSGATSTDFSADFFTTYFDPIISFQYDTSTLNYTQSKFERDLYILQIFSEGILKGYASSDINSTDKQISILTYFSENYDTLIATYDSSLFYDSYALIPIKKRVLQIVYNILNSGLTVTTQTDLEILVGLIEEIDNDYSDLIADGNDQQNVRQNFIQSLSLLQTQISNLYDSTSSTYTFFYNRVIALQASLVSAYTSSLTEGESSSIIEGSSNIQFLLVSSTGGSKTLTSKFDSNDNVYVSDQSILSTYNIKYFETSFSSSSNSSAATSTIIDINAYDDTSTLQSIDFSSSTTTYLNSIKRVLLAQSRNLQTTNYVQYQLKMSESKLSELTGDSNPYCVYYDTTNNIWSTSGITTVSYDEETGILICQTTHFSTFSADYIAQETIVTQVYYFDGNDIIYYSIVGGTIGVVLLFLLISFFTFTLWDYNPPKLPMYTTQFTFCRIFGSTFLLYYPLLSAFIGPQRANINLQVPKIHKMMNLFMILFAMSFTLTMLNYFIDYDPNDPDKMIKLIILGSVLCGGCLILRILFNSIVSIVFLMDAVQPEFSDGSKPSKRGKKSSRQKSRPEEESLMSGGEGSIKKKSTSSTSSKKYKKTRSKKLKEKYDFQMEGGSSDDDQINQKSRSKNKKKKMRPNFDSYNDDDLDEGKFQNKYSKGEMISGQKNYNGITAINDTISGNERSFSNINQFESTEKSKKSKRKVNESNFEVTSPQKKKKKKKTSESSKMDVESSDNNNIYSSKQKKRKAKSKDKFASDDDEKSDLKFGSVSKQSYYSGRDQLGQYSINASNSFSKSNYRSKSYMSDESESKQAKRSKQSKRSKQLEDTKSPHYTLLRIIITVVKLIILLAFMGITFWLMRYLKDYDTVIDFSIVLSASFGAQILVIDLLFILIFAGFFKCMGNGKCARISASILLGNAHSSCVNGLIYDLSNKI